MSIKAMLTVWNESQTSSTELVLMLALADAANDDGYCYPSQELLAKRCRISRRQVIRLLPNLVNLKELYISPHRGRRRSDDYLITLNMTVEHMAASLSRYFGLDMAEAVAAAKRHLSTENVTSRVENVTPASHLDGAENVTSRVENVTSRVENVTYRAENVTSDVTRSVLTVINPINREGEAAQAPQPLTPTPAPAPVQEIRGNLDDPRIRLGDPPIVPPTPNGNGAKPGKTYGQVTSVHVDARKFVNGFVPAGKGTTPVEVYYERFSVSDERARLTRPQEDDLARACPDLAHLREVVTEYSQRPYAPRNLKLIMEWYTKGIPTHGNSNKNGGSNGFGAGSVATGGVSTNPATDAATAELYERIRANNRRWKAIDAAAAAAN